MRVFILGIGATGSLIAKFLVRRGHEVVCGDREPERARRFLGRRSPHLIHAVNARNVRSIVKAAKGCGLIVNACPSVYNHTVMRAALRLRAHYLDMASHLQRSPFRAEQLRFDARFRAKRRIALINTGVAPGLTNLLVARAAELLDGLDRVQVRLYEGTVSDDPVSQWSAEASFDEAVSRPRIYRAGRFRLGQRFGEREVFRFPAPIGPVGVVLAAQDEVVTIPRVFRLCDMDAKFGGPDIDRLRRWYRQGRLHRSHGMASAKFPDTTPPRAMRRLIRRGILRNARFAAAILVDGRKNDRRLTVRWDATVPSLFQLHRLGIHVSPIAWATAQMASLFAGHLPVGRSGVYPPESLPPETRRAILRDARARGISLAKRVTRHKPVDEFDF